MAAIQQPVTQPARADEGVVAKLGGKVRHWKDQFTAASKELEVLRKEHAELKAKVQSPDEQTKELAAIKQQLRDSQHYEKFAELAKEAKAKQAALKHLWQVSGYRAEADEIDEKAIAKLIEQLRQEADYAFDTGNHDTGNNTVSAAREPVKARSGLEFRSTPEPAGGGRASRNMGGDGTIVTPEMRADPKFMLNPRNKELIVAAAKEGRFK
jgi:alanyl-tRNA synthetase